MQYKQNINIVVGADHGGFSLRQELIPWLENIGVTVSDVGAVSYDRDDDYPDFAKAVALRVLSETGLRGIIICGSGVGASISANKIPGIRAAICHDSYSSRQGVEHDDMNVLCLGARVVGIELAKEIITAFIFAKFTGEERHQRRLNKVISIETSRGDV